MNTIKLTTAAAVAEFSPRFAALAALEELDALERAAVARNQKAIQACPETLAWIRGEREKEHWWHVVALRRIWSERCRRFRRRWRICGAGWQPDQGKKKPG